MPYLKFSLFFVFALFYQERLLANFEEELLEKLILAEEGDVIEIPEGTHIISSQLSLRASKVTIRGKGKEKSILSFKTQSSGAEGLYISAKDIILEDFAILDTDGDAIKAINSENLIMRRLKVGWTGGISSENGGYGFYPVMSKNILIEDCEAFGASDSGIYVGQSENIIVRRNYVHKNVSGIEIENSEKADVYDNLAEGNTSGILVFSLPGLSRHGSKTRVYRNTIRNNNIENFSEPGNVVAYVPEGTGLMVMANKEVEIFQNEILNHKTVSLLIVSYFALNASGDYPENYDPLPRKIFFYDNKVEKTGFEPKGGSSEESREQILLLTYVLGVPFPGIIYDGFGAVQEEKHTNPLQICLKESSDLSFVSLDLENELFSLTRKKDFYTCDIEKLDPVVLPF